MSVALCPEASSMLADAEILSAARALNLAAGGGGQAKLMSRLFKRNLGLDELTRLITAEPALAMRTLRVANSAFYQRCGEVGTVDRAVQVLGLASVKGIAAAACMDRTLSSRPGLASAEVARLRSHSIAVACAAQALARQLLPRQEAEAFMAGMLHDVGMLVLWALRPQQMAGHAGGSAELIGHHEHCGQLVMQSWQLPGWLQQVVALHHCGALPEDTTGTLCLITRVAEALSARMGYGLAAEAGEIGDDDLERAGSTLGMDEAALAKLAESLPEQIDQFNSALSA